MVRLFFYLTVCFSIILPVIKNKAEKPAVGNVEVGWNKKKKIKKGTSTHINKK